MRERINPKPFGLSSRICLEHKGPADFILVMNRKSRIIMKDAKAIVSKAAKIKEKVPQASVSLETTAPVCSKSIQFLTENGVKIMKKA